MMGAHQIPPSDSADVTWEPITRISSWSNDFDWKQCRSVGFKAGLWLWPWQLNAGNMNDAFGGAAFLNFGPFEFELHYAVSKRMAEKMSDI